MADRQRSSIPIVGSVITTVFLAITLGVGYKIAISMTSYPSGPIAFSWNAVAFLIGLALAILVPFLIIMEPWHK